MNEPSPVTPHRDRTSATWKWTKRIGCALMVLSFTCCFAMCGGFWFTQDALRNMNKEDVDRIHAEGLQRGDLAALHARAAPAFRKRYALEDLQKFLKDRPGVLERDHFFGMEFVRRTIDGVEYVKIKSKSGWIALDHTEIVFVVIDGEYRLIGISPGMDELVPLDFRIGAGGGGRRRGWD